jgi:hypothetical protein
VVLAAITGTTLPVITALVAGAFAARLLGGWVKRPAPHRLCWGLGFLLFAGGAAAEAYGAAGGWTALEFRLYYLLGGVLAVALLGLGSVWLNLPRSAALVATGAVAACVPAAAVTVFAASMHEALLAHGGLRPPPDNTLGGLAFVWAIVLNSLGTLALVGGSLRAIWRGRAREANILVVAGVASVALSGILTRLGSYGFVYVGQLLGIVLLFAGFELAGRPLGRRPTLGPRPVSSVRRGA